MIHLDTHVVVWLYLGDLSLFPASVRRELNRSDLVISPVVELELQYLHEIERVRVPASDIVHELEQSIALQFSDTSFHSVVRAAMSHSWTRDPFDRMIVAQAAVDGAPLLTKDANIRRHHRAAFWGRRRRG